MRPEAMEMAIKFIYLSESATDIPTTVPESAEQDFLRVLERLSRQLEIPQLWHSVIDCGDRRISRQRRSDEFALCQAQVQKWYQESVLKHSFLVDRDRADKVRWDRSNSIFADVLLRADDVDDEDESASEEDSPSGWSESIPIGPMAPASQSPSRVRRSTTSTLFPAHRAMLIRSDFFLTMFSSSFKEAQSTEHLQIVRVGCAPRVLEVVLAFLYTDQAEIPPDIAIDVLFAADLLLIPELANKATGVITTQSVIEKAPSGENLGPVAGTASIDPPHTNDIPSLSIYDVIRAGWLCRRVRLEEFGGAPSEVDVCLHSLTCWGT